MSRCGRCCARRERTYAELGLADEGLTDDQLLDAMMAHPILINRPIVVSPLGVKLCRPSEEVLDLLPEPQRAAFTRRMARGSWMRPAASTTRRPPSHERSDCPPGRCTGQGSVHGNVRALPDAMGHAVHRGRIALGRLVPGAFHLIGAAEVAQVTCQWRYWSG